MEEIEPRAERVLASVPSWIWDGARLPVPIEDIADSHFGLLVRDVDDLSLAPGAPALGPDQSLSGLLLPTLGEIWVNAHEATEWPPRRRLDFLLTLGELFTLVVYGQLILEQAALTDLPEDTIDQIFDVLVRDFSAYAVRLHGVPSSTEAQQAWALAHVRKPVVDEERFERVWSKVRALAGAYEMRA